MLPAWLCSRCSFTSPAWQGSEAFTLCTACERELKEARAPELARVIRKSVDVVRFCPVEAFHATVLALLCLFPASMEIWVPRSQIHEESEVIEDGDSGELITTAWWAERAELDHLSL